MKRSLLLAATVLSMASAYAQPHTWLVYGSAGLSQNSNSNTNVYPGGTNTNWNVTPGIGYQFNKHLTVGVEGSYNHIENSYSGLGPGVPVVGMPIVPYYSVNNITINWSAGAFFRYTQNVGKIFFVYGQVNADYLSSTFHDNDGYVMNGNYVTPGAPTANGFQINLFPAIGARVYRGLALNFSFGGITYNTMSEDVAYYGNNKTSNVDLTLGQQVNIGVSENFSCHMHRHHKHHHAEAGSEYRHVENGADDEDAPAVEKQHKEKKERKEKKEKKEKNEDAE